MNLQKLVTLLILSTSLATQAGAPAPDINAALAQASQLPSEYDRKNALLNVVAQWNPTTSPDFAYRIKDASSRLRPQFRQEINNAISARQAAPPAPVAADIAPVIAPAPSAPPAEEAAPPTYTPPAPSSPAVPVKGLAYYQSEATKFDAAITAADTVAQAAKTRAGKAVAVVVKAKGDKTQVVSASQLAGSAAKDAQTAADNGHKYAIKVQAAQDVETAKTAFAQVAKSHKTVVASRDAAKKAADQAVALAQSQQSSTTTAGQNVAEEVKANDAAAQAALALVSQGDEASLLKVLQGQQADTGSLASVDKSARVKVLMAVINKWHPPTMPNITEDTFNPILTGGYIEDKYIAGIKKSIATRITITSPVQPKANPIAAANDLLKQAAAGDPGSLITVLFGEKDNIGSLRSIIGDDYMAKRKTVFMSALNTWDAKTYPSLAGAFKVAASLLQPGADVKDAKDVVAKMVGPRATAPVGADPIAAANQLIATGDAISLMTVLLGEKNDTGSLQSFVGSNLAKRKDVFMSALGAWNPVKQPALEGAFMAATNLLKPEEIKTAKNAVLEKKANPAPSQPSSSSVGEEV